MRVLVTGVSGFLASHVVLQLLEAGYTVRGTARGAKVDLARSAFAAYPKFEVIEIGDVATGDFSAALEGVDALIHTAAPLPGHASPETTLKSAVDGTLNVIRQAVEAGVHKVVLTSTLGTVVDPDVKQAYQGIELTEKDWGQGTVADIHRGPYWAYYIAKTTAEAEAWKFAASHPELDLSTILASYLVGPTIWPFHPVDTTTLGTNSMLYDLISGEGGRNLPPQGPPWLCDVRDAARAHIKALQLPPPQNGGEQDRRIIVYTEIVTLKDIVEYIAQTRPELKERLPSTEADNSSTRTLSTISNSRMKELLGMRDWISWQKTVDDTVDMLLSAKTTWQ